MNEPRVEFSPEDFVLAFETAIQYNHVDTLRAVLDHYQVSRQDCFAGFASAFALVYHKLISVMIDFGIRVEYNDLVSMIC